MLGCQYAGWRYWTSCLAVVLWLQTTPSKGAEGNLTDPEHRDQAVRRVLAVYSQDRLLPANRIADEALRGALGSSHDYEIEFYSEHLDASRFPGEQQDRLLCDFLRDKYADHPPDLVFAGGARALHFLLRHRTELFRGIPVVYWGVPTARIKDEPLDDRVVGIPMSFRFADSLALAFRLQPSTRFVTVVGGTSSVDADFITQAQDQLAGFEQRVSISWLTNQSLPELRESLSRLPPNSIVLYLSMYQDRDGTAFFPRDALRLFAPYSNTPIYGSFDSYVGAGIVGGEMVPFEEMGRKAGEVGLRILGGEEPVRAVIGKEHSPAAIFDWRELQRWNIDPNRLPSNARILFREPSLWQQHKWLILGGTALCLFEAVLIASLILELRRRRQAEALARQQRTELAHASRLATVGELTASLAHEINQPLAAILSAAQAGLRFMSAERSDPAEIRDILQNIVQDNKRAAAVVSGLRSMLRRQTSRREQIDLADAVQEILNLLHTELLTNHIDVSVRCQPDCQVLADKTQIQQVVLNLVMNSIEAMRSSESDPRRIEVVSMREAGNTVKITVSDTGPGIPPEDKAKLFDSFWTTKSQGMGIGLAICRSILESHGGRIWLDQSQPGKTTFCFFLPLSPEP